MQQARFDWACSWTVLVSASYRPGLSRIQHLKIIIVKIWNLKHPQMYSYGGCQGIFNVMQVPFYDKRQLKMISYCNDKNFHRWEKKNGKIIWQSFPALLVVEDIRWPSIQLFQTQAGNWVETLTFRKLAGYLPHMKASKVPGQTRIYVFFNLRIKHLPSLSVFWCLTDRFLFDLQIKEKTAWWKFYY